MQLIFLMLGKPVIDLEEVKIGSFKSKPDLRAPLVEYQSTTPWMMFVSARLQKDNVYSKSKLAQQMHRWDGLLDIIVQSRQSWL